MSDERTVWLVRHGNRADFIDEQWMQHAQRPHDPPLAPDGHVQAREVGEELRAKAVDHIVASPFLRTVETAQGIASVLNKPFALEAGLSEAHYDHWFQKRPDFLATSVLRETAPNISIDYVSRVTPAYPESREQMLERTRRTLKHLLTTCPGNLLIVAHGGSIWGLAKALNEDNSVQTPLCCIITCVQSEKKWHLKTDGSDISHLSGEENTLRLH